MILSESPNIEVVNADCMDVMKTFSDKQFDLAICDPPYGINFGNYKRTNKDKYGKRFIKEAWDKEAWDKEAWDKEAWDKYFSELQRISVNQIVWGANYFFMPPTQGFIFWYKRNPVPNFSDGEYAWTSFQTPAKCFDYMYYGGLEFHKKAEDKIHPTQKPIALYEWLLINFAKPGDKIIDTHLGSGSSAIACFKNGFEFTGIELNTRYFEASIKRFKQITSQQRMF